MNTVFDPLMIFISEDDWQDEEKRDEFLNHLFDNLETIIKYNITQVYWTDELETYLWEYPQLPPWRLDRDWKLKLVPRIYNSFLKCRENIKDFDESTVCYADPLLNALCSKAEIHNCFLKLVHFLIRKEELFYFCVGIPNRSSRIYVFYCNCHDCKIEPIQINQADEWFEELKKRDPWLKNNLPKRGEKCPYPYVPPKSHYAEKREDFPTEPYTDGRRGFIDRKNQLWLWDKQEEHWDVQIQPYERGNYFRVSPDGRLLDD